MVELQLYSRVEVYRRVWLRIPGNHTAGFYSRHKHDRSEMLQFYLRNRVGSGGSVHGRHVSMADQGIEPCPRAWLEVHIDLIRS